MACLRRSAGYRKLMRPAVEVAFRIVVQAFDRAGNVGQLFGQIGERVELARGSISPPGNSSAVRSTVKRLSTVSVVEAAGKGGERHAIVESVVKPAQALRLRLDHEFRRDSRWSCPSRGRIIMRCSPNSTGRA